MGKYSDDGRTYITDSGEPVAVIPETQAMINAASGGLQYGQAPAGALPSLTAAAAAQPSTFGSAGLLAPTDTSGLTAPVNTASAFVPPAPDLTGGMSKMPAADGGFGSTLPSVGTPSSDGLVEVEGNGATPAATNLNADTGTSAFTQPLTINQTETTSEGLTKRGIGWIDEAVKAQADAIDAQEKAKVATLNAETEKANAVAAVSRNFRLQEEAKQAEVEKAKLDWDMRIKEADDKFRGANIDSGRLWRDSSTGSKIAAGVGIMLGALGQALTGKDNPALKIIENAIDKDIDIQKAMMEKAGKESDRTRSAYSTYLQATGSEAAARNQIKILTLEELGAKYDAAAAANKSPEMAAAAQKAKADMLARANELKAKSEVYRSTTKPVAITAAKPIPTGATRWPQATGDDMRARGNVMNAGARITDMLKDTKKMEKVMGPIDSKVQELAASFGLPVDEDYLTYRTETGALVAAILKQMSGVGVNEAEYKRWATLLPMIQKNPENAKAEFEAFMERERTDYEGARTSHAANLANPEDRATFEATWPTMAGTKKKEQGFKPNP